MIIGPNQTQRVDETSGHPNSHQVATHTSQATPQSPTQTHTGAIIASQAPPITSCANFLRTHKEALAAIFDEVGLNFKEIFDYDPERIRNDKEDSSLILGVLESLVDKHPATVVAVLKIATTNCNFTIGHWLALKGDDTVRSRFLELLQSLVPQHPQDVAQILKIATTNLNKTIGHWLAGEADGEVGLRFWKLETVAGYPLAIQKAMSQDKIERANMLEKLKGLPPEHIAQILQMEEPVKGKSLGHCIVRGGGRELIGMFLDLVELCPEPLAEALAVQLLRLRRFFRTNSEYMVRLTYILVT